MEIQPNDTVGRYLDIIYRRNSPSRNAAIGTAVMLCSEFLPRDYTGGELVQSGFFVSGALLALSGSAKVIKPRLIEFRAGRTLREEDQGSVPEEQ